MLFIPNITTSLPGFVVDKVMYMAWYVHMYVRGMYHMEWFNASGISVQVLWFATDGAWLAKEPVTMGVSTIVLCRSPITTWR